ncbi:MAG: tRNA dihydrouridine synthase DusB [Acidimicrobiia bacterium]
MELRIGTLSVDPPVVLAPMAGVTNSAFRSLCRSYGAGLYVSEMISARAFVERNERTTRMLAFGPDEEVRSVQLYGVDPEFTAEAARRLVADHGVHHIDLNFGCPAAKVTRKGGGAALPVHARLLHSIVDAAVRVAGPAPVTVKMRIGVDDGHHTFLPAAQAAADAGAAAIALHARTAEQLYSGDADWTAIGELKSAIPGVPILGNGDIWEAHDALRMMDQTGCDGVVIGRGCLGRPWLFRDLVDAFAGRSVQPAPNLGGVIAVMRDHARRLVALFGDEGAGVRDFRKHVSWYLTGYPVGGQRRRELALCSTISELDDRLGELDPGTALPPGAERIARGHTNGPRRVDLPERWLETADDLTVPVGADAVVSGG